jgi:sec-independent protein translocase protein TatA
MGLDNPIHIAFLLILLLLVFGAKRLPEMGRSLGSGMRGFRDALTGEDSQSALATPRLQSVPVAQVEHAAADPASAQVVQQAAPIAAGTSAEAPVAANTHEPPAPVVA